MFASDRVSPASFASRGLSPGAVALIGTICAGAGLFTIPNSVLLLLGQWRSDDLKSMGLLVPFVAWALILRDWRSVDWETDGSWWGFTLLAGVAALMFVRDQTLLIVTVGKDWLLQIPPLPLVAILYAAAVVLLLGGTRLLRAAWFPVLFMGAVIPVPQTFSRRVDLPLQHLSATVARGFAHLLGERLTSDNLRLMFTPDFGMFIAPGCNGIRGSVTLGLAAVVVAYLYRFRWFIAAPVVAGAVLLGYLFNFVRLCLLVVYYKIALPYPWLQDRAKGADYLIGGGLFVLALYLFFGVADRLRRDSQGVASVPAMPNAAFPKTHRAALRGTRRAAPLAAHAGALLGLAAVFGFDAMHAQHLDSQGKAPLPPMPAQLGDYRLVRTYQDTLIDGAVVYTWGEYALPVTNPVTGLVTAPADQSTAHIAVGISPEMDVHDTEVCHLARGEDPTSHGTILAESAGGEVALVAATYNNGTEQTLEASTVCDGGQCRQFTQTAGNATVIYARPHRSLPMQRSGDRAVPVLLKIESPDAVSPAQVVGPQLAVQLKAFLRGVDLAALAGRFRHTG